MRSVSQQARVRTRQGWGGEGAHRGAVTSSPESRRLSAPRASRRRQLSEQLTYGVAYLRSCLHLPPQELVGQLDEAQVRAAMRASIKLKDSKAVAMGEDGMYELTAAYDKVRKRL